MQWRNYITADPAILQGKAIIKGTRISVEHVLDCLGRGWTVNDIVTRYPHVPREGVVACLEYARDLVRSETITAARH